jgi:2'-hydroxyisoflavone reductase
VKLLVLGGTKFLGRAAVEAALERGDEVTLFNRGETNAELFPSVEKLRGDRAEDVSAVAGRSWDAVIDTSGYFPGVVRRSAEALRDSVERYLFVSSISVYADFSTGPSEEAPRAELGDQPIDEMLP